MKKIYILASILFFLLGSVPSTSWGAYIYDTDPDLVLTCFEAVNPTSMTLALKSRNGSHTFSGTVAPGGRYVFSGSEWVSGKLDYNPRWEMISSPFTLYTTNPLVDCRDGFRPSSPQWWLYYWNPPPPPVNGSCGSIDPTTTNSQFYSSYPSGGSCTTGTQTSFQLSGGGVGVEWTCSGENGGSNASCSYTFAPEPPTPQPITGYFASPVSVSSGSYNWNISLTLSQSGTLDPLDIQIWNAFTIDSATTSGDSIILSISPTTPPLAVECTTYTLTVPSSAIQGNDGVSANPDPITGSFSVVGCPTPPDPEPPVNTGSTSSGSWTPPTQSGSYMALWYVDPNSGARYLDIGSLMYLLVFGSLAIAITYALFRILKSIITGKRLF